jgi:dienelactone hydrolase
MKIGRIVKVLEDKERKETLIECEENRKVIVSIYYPVDESWEENRQAFYKELYSPREDEYVNTLKMAVALQNDMEKIKFLEEIKCNIYNNAPISIKQVVYPVILQSTGLGSPRDYMTFNVERLVNDGYIVIAIGHLYDSMLTILPNGEVVKPLVKELTQDDKVNIVNVRKEDILFVLSKLEQLNKEDDVVKSKLDLQRIGLVGHSVGGASVFKASQCECKVKATVLFDASLQFFDIDEKQSLNTPTLNFRRGSFDYKTSMSMFINYLKDKVDAEKFKTEMITYDRVLRDSDDEQKKLFNYVSAYKSFIKLNGSNHMTFTDFPIIAGNKMVSEILSLEKAHGIINDITIRFFDEFLIGNQGEYSKFIKNTDYVTLIDENGQPISDNIKA